MSKNFLLGNGVALVGILFFLFFPTQDIAQEVFKSIAFLFVLPYLGIRFLLKLRLTDFGFRSAITIQNAIWLLLFLIAALVSWVVLYMYVPTVRLYEAPQAIRDNFFFFFIYAVFLAGLFAFLYEFFFRGFLYHLWSEQSRWAIVWQYIAFVGVVFIGSEYFADLFPLIFAGIFSSGLMYLTRSFLFSFLFIWLFVILGDSILLQLFSL